MKRRDGVARMGVGSKGSARLSPWGCKGWTCGSSVRGVGSEYRELLCRELVFEKINELNCYWCGGVGCTPSATET